LFSEIMLRIDTLLTKKAAYILKLLISLNKLYALFKIT
jgi:hypothetical protein